MGSADNATIVRYRLRQGGEDLGLLTLPEFLADNAEIDPETVDAIRLLAPGETYADGGGAQPVWSMTRIECAIAV